MLAFDQIFVACRHAVQAAVVRVFRESYEYDLQDSDFIWHHSPDQPKLSLHMVIKTRPHLLIFADTYQVITVSLKKRISYKILLIS